MANFEDYIKSGGLPTVMYLIKQPWKGSRFTLAKNVLLALALANDPYTNIHGYALYFTQEYNIPR